MTRAVWAETPLANWIRAQLDARGWTTKRELIDALAAERGIAWKTAERYVQRWTSEGEGAGDKNLKALAAIFEAEPPGISRPDRFDEVLDAIAGLHARLDQIVAPLEADGPPEPVPTGPPGSRKAPGGTRR